MERKRKRNGESAAATAAAAAAGGSEAEKGAGDAGSGTGSAAGAGAISSQVRTSVCAESEHVSDEGVFFFLFFFFSLFPSQHEHGRHTGRFFVARSQSGRLGCVGFGMLKTFKVVTRVESASLCVSPDGNGQPPVAGLFGIVCAGARPRFRVQARYPRVARRPSELWK